MICEKLEDGTWMATIRENGRVFLGFGPFRAEARNYCAELWFASMEKNDE